MKDTCYYDDALNNYDKDNRFVIPTTVDLLFNQSAIYNILNNFSEHVTGRPLSKDIFYIIWDKIDFSHDDIDNDILYNLDTLYITDIVCKGAIKYKRKKKCTYRLKKLYRYEECF